MSVVPLRQETTSDDCVIEVPRERPVKAGDYYVEFRHHETCLYFGKKAKLALWFSIASGEFAGRLVPRYYNVERIIGKPGRGGAFKPPIRGQFLIDYCRLFLKPTDRLDRISLDPFRQHTLQARVGNVGKTSFGEDLPAQLRYTVIREFLEVYK